MRVRLQRQLAATIGTPDARPLDREPPTTQRDLASLMAVAHRRAVAIVFALRTDDLVDFLFHQLGEHAEPDADAEREQPLPRSADQLPERLLHTQRQHGLQREPGRGERYGCLLHGGSSLDLGRIASNAPNKSGRGRRDRRQVLRATGQPPVLDCAHHAVLLSDCLVVKSSGSQVTNRPVYVAIGVNLGRARMAPRPQSVTQRI